MTNEKKTTQEEHNKFLTKYNDIIKTENDIIQTLEDLKSLKNEINNRIVDASKEKLFYRIYSTLKTNPNAVKNHMKNRSIVQQCQIMKSKIDSSIKETQKKLLILEKQANEKKNRSLNNHTNRIIKGKK